MFSRILYAQQPVTKNFHISPRFSPTGFYREANSVLLLAHLCTAVKVYLHMYNGNVQQNPLCVESCVKVYLHMYNGNVQQNSLCLESCVTKELSISPRLWRTIFDPDANSVLLRAHLCTAVDSMHRKPCVRDCSREREGLYNGNVQQNPLCAASCVTKDIPISPRLSPTIFDPDANSVLLRAHPVFEIGQGGVKVCTTGMSSRTLSAQHPVSLHLSPVLAKVILSPGKSSTLQCTVFLF